MTRAFWLIAGLLLLTGPHPASAQDHSGNWTGTVVESASDCQNIRKAAPGDYRLTILQEGDALTIMENTGRRPYTGYLEPENAGRVQVRGTYADHGGYVTEDVVLEFSSRQTGTGSSVWRWSDGWHQCGGSFRFTLKKDPAP